MVANNFTARAAQSATTIQAQRFIMMLSSLSAVVGTNRWYAWATTALHLIQSGISGRNGSIIFALAEVKADARVDTGFSAR
jgi:hypothetical protein